MSGEEFEHDEVLARVRMSRRGFVKKLIVGGVFAGPVVASFSMNELASGATARALGAYTPTPGAQHWGHRGFGPYTAAAPYVPFDLNPD